MVARHTYLGTVQLPDWVDSLVQRVPVGKHSLGGHSRVPH